MIAVAVVAFAILGALRAGSTPAAAPADEAGVVVAKITNLSPAVSDAVGTGGLKNPLRPPAVARSVAPGRPNLLYIGAEYCPYCAAERWSVVVALSRFGTFDGLKLTTSSPTDVYPNTPTLTFHGATYRSDYLDFTAVETADRYGKALEPMPAGAQALMQSMSGGTGIPFMNFDGRWYTAGSGFTPDVLAGQSWMQIANQLAEPSSPTGRAAIGNANYLTAGICRLTGGQPAATCSSAGVRAADATIR